MAAYKPVGRKTNEELRPREHLYEHEIDKLIEAARGRRHYIRDQALILTAYRHALRPAEACGLTWKQICFETNRIMVKRAKNGVGGEQCIEDREIRYLKRLLKEKEKKKCASPYVFVSAKGGPLSVCGFNDLIEILGKKAGIEFKVHPHMLRHSWGYKAVNNNVSLRRMQVYLGHKCITNTTRYLAVEAMDFSEMFNS